MPMSTTAPVSASTLGHRDAVGPQTHAVGTGVSAEQQDVVLAVDGRLDTAVGEDRVEQADGRGRRHGDDSSAVRRGHEEGGDREAADETARERRDAARIARAAARRGVRITHSTA